MVVIMWHLDLQLPMQSVPIITKAVSSNSVLVVEEAGVPGENHQSWASNR
jgi:hypothetical protein